MNNIYILVDPFKLLSQANAEDLFERIAQDIVVKVDLPKYIKKHLHDLLDEDKERVLLKINPPARTRHLCFYG